MLKRISPASYNFLNIRNSPWNIGKNRNLFSFSFYDLKFFSIKYFKRRRRGCLPYIAINAI